MSLTCDLAELANEFGRSLPGEFESKWGGRGIDERPRLRPFQASFGQQTNYLRSPVPHMGEVDIHNFGRCLCSPTTG
jgi:hypothetical protein